ncbi:TonB-dependent receptor [Duganella sp. FT109W]|uniref:TonB-dependent receptor n=1 Tax=Duganella margarita TaxID=2692170 RepID=A0ABW9WGY4_9BURK|nr:TonB-dependent receptor [Duganella margarita]MYN40387.1 TonB-dependent receptor [Duganella margarita]
MYSKLGVIAAGSVAVLQCGVPAQAQETGEAVPTVVQVTGQVLGKGEARANSVIDQAVIAEQPAGLDPLKLLARVPGMQVSSSDALTGSFSMRLSMRGFNKEQIGISIDGIPNGSTLSNGGTMPNRLLDPANLVRVDASQTAGDLGTPSNQALGGYIDFKTRDPAKERGGEVELSTGSFGYQRGFVRVDTGKLASGTSAYLDYSHEYVRTWPGDESGRNTRRHIDARILQDLGGGSSLRATVSYNKFSDNDYDAVALLAASSKLYKATFYGDPTTDGLTDHWTGNPAIDQNYRGTRGINSEDTLMHIDWTQRFGDSGKLTVKPYWHKQDGNGWFYVPYVQLPSNGLVYSPVAAGGKPTAVVQECYQNQYQRTASGALIPVSAISYPSGASSASLATAGCPAAAKYAMNPVAQWGAREASTRRSDNAIDRKGALAEVSSTLGEYQRIRVGGWVERTTRDKDRNWFAVTDPTVSGAFKDSALYSITQDRHYSSNTAMAYAQDKVSLMDNRLQLDLGATYQRFKEDYSSAVEFNGVRTLEVSSRLLPKLAALFRVNDDWEVFASGSKNFSAIPDTVFEGTAAVDSKNGIKPETSINKDIGVRWTSDNGYGAALSAYKIDYRDRISIQNGNPNGDIFSRDATTTFANQGGISSQGVELTLRASGASYELYANASYNDAHYVGDTPAEGIKANDPVLGAPRRSAFAEATWKPSEAWRLTANAHYVGEAAGTYGDVPNTVITGGPAVYLRQYMPAYTLVGLNFSYKPSGSLFGYGSRTEFAVNVDNLFDRRYLGGVGAELTSSNPLTTGRYFLGSPRTLYATMRVKF